MVRALIVGFFAILLLVWSTFKFLERHPLPRRMTTLQQLYMHYPELMEIDKHFVGPCPPLLPPTGSIIVGLRNEIMEEYRAVRHCFPQVWKILAARQRPEMERALSEGRLDIPADRFR